MLVEVMPIRSTIWYTIVGEDIYSQTFTSIWTNVEQQIAGQFSSNIKQHCYSIYVNSTKT